MDEADELDPITLLQEAVVDLAAKLFWLFNACDLVTREEAMQLIAEFNEMYGLVEDLDVVDEAWADGLTPEDFE